jgi:hypothetical protein
MGRQVVITWSGGPYPSTGYMVSQPFAAGGNRSYPEFGAITGNPWYMGYFTLTIALEPSVKRVAGAGHSIVGRIGTRGKRSGGG